MITSKTIEKEETTDKFIRFLSTGTHKDVRSSVIMESDNDWINPCHPKFVKLLKLPRIIRYEYYSEAITTVSYKVYNTTSLWYLVLACSNYLHPHEIPNGEILILPSIESVVLALKEPVVSNVGKTIII